MEPNYEQALRDELAGLERRIASIKVTDGDTRVLEARVAGIREQLSETAPAAETVKRNGARRGRETRPADGGEVPEV